MNTFQGIQSGIIGSIVGFLSLCVEKVTSAVETKTHSGLLPALVGGVIFSFLYAMILLLGLRLGRSWHRRLVNGFVYGILGGFLGDVLGSFAPLTSNGLFNDIVASLFCGLLVTLLFFETNRHAAFVTLMMAIVLLFLIVGIKANLFDFITAFLIAVSTWLVYPLVPTLLVEGKEQS